MKPAQRNAVTIGIVVVAIAAAWWYATARLTSRPLKVAAATIVQIDPAKGTGEIEFVHPKSGRTLQVPGRMAPTCTITINDRPATLADVRVGDVAAMEGTIHADRTVEATVVRITRPPSGPSSADRRLAGSTSSSSESQPPTPSSTSPAAGGGR